VTVDAILDYAEFSIDPARVGYQAILVDATQGKARVKRRSATATRARPSRRSNCRSAAHVSHQRRGDAARSSRAADLCRRSTGPGWMHSSAAGRLTRSTSCARMPPATPAVLATARPAPAAVRRRSSSPTGAPASARTGR
jgi:hypothetical protein